MSFRELEEPDGDEQLQEEEAEILHAEGNDQDLDAMRHTSLGNRQTLHFGGTPIVEEQKQEIQNKESLRGLGFGGNALKDNPIDDSLFRAGN